MPQPESTPPFENLTPGNASGEQQPTAGKELSSPPAASSVKKIIWPSFEGPLAGTGKPLGLPHEPQVELLQQPDGKSKIIVTCCCGRRIEVICET
jgi:hypothetical protein